MSLYLLIPYICGANCKAARQPAAAAGLAMQRGRVAGCCYHTCIGISVVYVVNICIAGIIADI